jgi:hypothetical protein
MRKTNLIFSVQNPQFAAYSYHNFLPAKNHALIDIAPSLFFRKMVTFATNSEFPGRAKMTAGGGRGGLRFFEKKKSGNSFSNFSKMKKLS